MKIEREKDVERHEMTMDRWMDGHRIDSEIQKVKERYFKKDSVLQENRVVDCRPLCIPTRRLRLDTLPAFATFGIDNLLSCDRACSLQEHFLSRAASRLVCADFLVCASFFF